MIELIHEIRPPPSAATQVTMFDIADACRGRQVHMPSRLDRATVTAFWRRPPKLGSGDAGGGVCPNHVDVTVCVSRRARYAGRGEVTRDMSLRPERAMIMWAREPLQKIPKDRLFPG